MPGERARMRVLAAARPIPEGMLIFAFNDNDDGCVFCAMLVTEPGRPTCRWCAWLLETNRAR